MHRLRAGALLIDDDFPYPCAAGLFGNTLSVLHQNGPQCSGSCPAGKYCAKATTEPVICGAGTYCPEGSPAPIDCPPGTYSADEQISSKDDCTDCDPGFFCSQGSRGQFETGTLGRAAPHDPPAASGRSL